MTAVCDRFAGLLGHARGSGRPDPAPTVVYVDVEHHEAVMWLDPDDPQRVMLCDVPDPGGRLPGPDQWTLWATLGGDSPRRELSGFEAPDFEARMWLIAAKLAQQANLPAFAQAAAERAGEHERDAAEWRGTAVEADHLAWPDGTPPLDDRCLRGADLPTRWLL